MSLRIKLLGNLNWVFFLNGAAGLANILALVWFARFLGSKELETYAIAVTAVHFAGAFLAAGFDQVVIRYPRDKGLWRAACTATLVQSSLLLFCMGVTLCVYWYVSPTFCEQSWLTGTLVVVSVSGGYFVQLFSAPIASELRYRFLSVSRLFAVLLGQVAGVSFAIAGFGVTSMAIRDLIVPSCMMIIFLSTRCVRPLRFSVRRSDYGVLWVFGSANWGLNVLDRLSRRFDYAAVGWILGPSVLSGYYVVRNLVEGVLGFLLVPVQTVLYGYYCRHAMLRERYRFSGMLFCFVFYGLAALLGLSMQALGSMLVGWLLGDEYVYAAVILPGLVVYAMMTVHYEVLKVRAMSESRHSNLLFARIAQVLALCVLAVPLCARWGVLGSSLVTLISGVVLVGVALFLVRAAAGENRAQ